MLKAEAMNKKQRPAHHVNDSATKFRNPDPAAGAPTWAELTGLSFPLGWYPPEPETPSQIRPIKVVTPDWGAEATKLREATSSNSEYLVATWLGHAGAMVELPSLKSSTTSKQSSFILFDPIFSGRAGPTRYIGTSRMRQSPCIAGDLPGCHAVFISHNHYDHLDLPTVLEIVAKFPDTKWFVPLGNKAWFTGSGILAENIVEMDWWGTWEGDLLQEKDGSNMDKTSWLKVSCVPAQHNSGRKGYDSGSTLWCGWVVERFTTNGTLSKSNAIRKGSVYHAGDTGYRRIAKSTAITPMFREIGAKFGSFDVSFIPIWRGGSLGIISYAGVRLLHQHMPSALHCSPEDAVNIHKDVKSRNTVAVHFGTFVGSELESQESVHEFYEACLANNIKDLRSKQNDDHGCAGTIDIGESILVDFD
jgi:N-acyl-phosphatidylethanolamine-hydrolysing phospholipase D